MSTAGPAAGPRHVHLDLVLDRRLVALVSVLVVQAVWLGVIMMGGWYSGPDLANLGAATGQPLDAHYLNMSLGGHFGAPARLVYWVLERVAPLTWGLTVVLRLVIQAVATYLVWRLLEELVGHRRWIPTLVLVYAVSPLLIPATAVLSNGLGLSIAQASVLGALLVHIRYVRGGPAWQGVLAGLLVLLAMSFADQALAIVLLLPALSLGFLHQGSWRQRLASSAQRWVSWATLAVMAAVFSGLYLQGGYSGRTANFSFADAADVAGQEWMQVLGPALLAGPWRWHTRPEEWVSYGSPPVVLQVLGQVALLGLVVLSVRRSGKRAFAAWALPIGSTIGGAVLVGYGRGDFLGFVGTSVPQVYRYSFFVPMTLVLGIALAFTTPERDTLVSDEDVPSRRPALAPAVLVFVVASAVSGLGFAGRFWDNRSRSYVHNLLSSVREAGPAVELYDTGVPDGVIPGLEPNHFVSDVLALGRVHATFGGSAPEPMFVTAEGRAVPGGFFKIADITNATQRDCGTFVHGAGATTVTLGPAPERNAWYLELQLYQPRANSLTLEVRDVDGDRLAIAGGSTTARTAGRLVAIHRRLGFGVPGSVTLSSTDPDTNLCLVHAYLGAPVAKQSS